MPIIKVRGIYTINVALDKKHCGYCDYEQDYICTLFKVNLKSSETCGIRRCKKCLKGEVNE